MDTKKAKLGDEHTAWSELEYYSDPVATGLIEALTTRVGTAESNITALAGKVTAAEDVNTTQQADIDALKGITVISANPAPAGN